MSYVIGKCKIKTTIITFAYLLEQLKYGMTYKAGEDVQQQELPFIADEFSGANILEGSWLDS